MSRTDKLLTFYRQVLNGMDCNITEDSLVQFVTARETMPVCIESPDLRLALPTQEILNQLKEGNVAAFHPMCENIILGQSPVISTLRRVAIESLSLKILSTMVGVVMAISDGAELSATHIKFAKDFDKVDEKTVKALTKLAMAIDPTTEHRLINVYMKHGGLIGDEQYKRIATVTFPLYSALLEATDTVYGVKMRKQDIRLFTSMLEKLFPNIGEKDEYSFGSNSLTCPYFHSLLNAFGNVTNQLNKVTYPFRKIIRDYTGEEPHVNLEYIDEFGEGHPYKDIIPPLDYNQGTDAGGRTMAAEPIEDLPSTPQVTHQPLKKDYVEQVSTPQPPPPMNTPQPPRQQPVPVRGSYLSKIKPIGAAEPTAKSIQAHNAPAAADQQNRDLSEIMYPPEMYPQMYAPPQVLQPQYPQFDAQGRMIGNPPPPAVPGYGMPSPQGYPVQQGYPPQPQGYPVQQGYPPHPQGYPPQPGYPPQQGYPVGQPVQGGYAPQPTAQRYPVFGNKGRVDNPNGIVNPNHHLQHPGRR